MDKTYIGIDPDTKASGVAVYQGSFKSLELMPLHKVFSFLMTMQPITVCISAGWLNKIVNFQNKEAAIGVRERISEKIGANHEIGKQLATFCKDNGIEYVLVRPRGKKATAEQFKKLTGWVGRTNQEHRDAAMTILSCLIKNN